MTYPAEVLRRRLLCAAVLTALLGGVAVTPALAAPFPLPAPGNVHLASGTTTSLTIDWDAVAGAPLYRVEYTPNQDQTGWKAAWFTPSYGTLSGLVSNTTYYVRVRVVDKSGAAQSDWSSTIPAATLTGPQLMRVASFNIKDPDNSGSCAAWDTRKSAVAADIASTNADVVGIQEAYDEQDRSTLMSAISAAGGQYAMTYPADQNDPGRDNRLLYRPAKVDLISTSYRLFDTQKSGDYPRFVVWATFRNKRNGHQFVVFTTHLAPGASVSVARAQWDQVAYLAKKYGVDRGLPVVVVGDFNTTKFEQPADTMLPAMKAKGFGDVLGQAYRSYTATTPRAESRVNAWINSFNGCKRSMTYTVAKDRIANNVDWIFATNSLRIPEWRTVAHYSGSSLTGTIASDHFLISAILALP